MAETLAVHAHLFSQRQITPNNNDILASSTSNVLLGQYTECLFCSLETLRKHDNTDLITETFFKSKILPTEGITSSIFPYFWQKKTAIENNCSPIILI